MNPKVSIIIPVYNGSNYLSEAIDSALAQTYKNIEIIVVNDGSNDNGATEKIAKSYGKKIRYYKKENGGVASALNLGIEKMTGEYFSWLSHDDLYYPNKIEKQIKFLKTLYDKKVVLYSNFSTLENGEINQVKLDHEMLLKNKKYSLLRGCINGITILVPKIILDKTGFFDPKLKYTQDYDYWMRAQERYSFVHMKDVLSITRLHAKQESRLVAAAVECDSLWIKMIDNMTDKEKTQYEGSLYNFYYEMIRFLRPTPYSGAQKYCEDKAYAIESIIKKLESSGSINADYINYVKIRNKHYEEKIMELEAEKLFYKNQAFLLEKDNKNLINTVESIYNSKDISNSKRYKIVEKMANIRKWIKR